MEPIARLTESIVLIDDLLFFPRTFLVIVICSPTNASLGNLSISYFQFKNQSKEEENAGEKLRDEINSMRNSFSESFGNLSKDIAKDMTGALTKVDEKVGVFNQQVEALNKGQQNFSRILAGVKQYGCLQNFL